MRELYAKGKRSIVYKEGNIIIKVIRSECQAINRLENEAYWLKRLNKKNIGPKFLKIENNELYMKFVKGERILEYSMKAKKSQVKKVLINLLEQCRILDLEFVNKYEMHKPLKHAIISNNKPVLIDFERCKKTKKPKNVTQLCQFYARYFGLKKLLTKAKPYKQTYSPQEFEDIKKCLMREKISM